MNKSLRVLLLEDSRDDAELIIRELQKGGFHPNYEQVDSPAGLIKFIKNYRWDVIISDFSMPKLNAPNALSILKQYGIDIPFIIVSGSVGEDVAVSTMKIGAHDYIMKENLTRLVPAVKREIQESQIRNERKRATESLRDRVRQLAVVAELGKKALQELTLEILMNEIAFTVVKTLKVDFCKILELSPDEKSLLLISGYGWKEGCVGKITLGADNNSQSGYTLQCKEPVIVEDLRTERRFRAPQLLVNHGVISGISVIIQGSARPYGVIGAHTRTKRNFSQDDIYFLQSVANILSSAIERKRVEVTLLEVNRELKKSRAAIQELAIRDELTGLFNRREMLRLLQEEIDRSYRYKHPMAFIILDFDHFKKVNDTYGHQTGDMVLEYFAQFLKDNVRFVDNVARYGGEEFAIILPEASQQEALDLAERLRENISKEPILITQPGGNEISISMTISLGVAGFPEGGDSLESMIQHADQALYKAKALGRNQVVQYTSSLSQD